MSFAESSTNVQFSDLKESLGSMLFPNGDIRIKLRFFNNRDPNIATMLLYVTLKIIDHANDF
jgi:hypothetical protein